MGIYHIGPHPEIYSTIYYSVKGYLKLNQFCCSESLSSNFITKIWTMACDWENLLKPGRNEN